jgi:hypothetical protein
MLALKTGALEYEPPPGFELPLNLINLPQGVLEDYHYEVDAGNVHVHPDFYKPRPW